MDQSLPFPSLDNLGVALQISVMFSPEEKQLFGLYSISFG